MAKTSNFLKKKGLLFSVIFFVLLLISTILIAIQSVNQREQSIERANYVISSYTNKVQYAIDSRLLNGEILKMIIIDSNGSINDFNRIAQQLSNEDPALQSLQLAPSGVVSYVYPLEGNEDAFGDLFNDPDRRDEAAFARDTKKVTLAGPFPLYQGGTGVVSRNPIYLSDSNGEEYFWGFSIVVLNIPQLFDMANLDDLVGQGYTFCIWRNRTDSGEIQFIHGNEKMDFSKSVNKTLTVPNGTWTLSILPASGSWTNWNSVTFLTMISLAMSILISLAIYGYLTIINQKRELAELSFLDSLTGLYNGRKLSATLKQLICTSEPFGIGYFDLNKFKKVNDQFGHDTGDRLLIEVARRMKACIQERDLAFRIGGDEFVLIIQGSKDLSFYKELKQKISQEIQRPFAVGAIDIHPQISCGFARYPIDETNIEKLVKIADMEMYENKKRHAE